MSAPNREDSRGPGPIRPAPDGKSVPLPSAYGLAMDPSTVTFDDGRVLMGGSPLRLLRLSPRARALTSKWDAGVAVGERPAERRLARRLVAAGIFDPRPVGAVFGPDDVTVVIPIRDRPDQLRRLLAALEGLACVVVDDGSSDAARTEEITRDAKARFIGLRTNAGPSVARNAGLSEVATPLAAFIDSDCIPSEGWLQPLIDHFDDPLVAAAAPRIVPAPVDPPTTLSRYESVRSSLDRGPAPGPVRPQSRIPFVPSAALMVRTDVVAGPLFDPDLRGGEDVDLVWRLVEAGWDVRYIPASTVVHEGPESIPSWLARRAFYGTTAGPLSRRHPSSLAPLHTSAWSAAVWGLAAARRPLLASATLATSVLLLARRLEGLVEEPGRAAFRIAGGGTVKSALPALGGLTRAWSPAFVVGLLFRRTRRAAAIALLAPAVGDWVANRGDLGPARYTAFHVADDLAYGSGVWLGCLRSRTLRPLVPRVALRARIWSRRSLISHLGDPERFINSGEQSVPSDTSIPG